MNKIRSLEGKGELDIFEIEKKILDSKTDLFELTGGEPTIHSKLYEIITFLAKNNKNYTLVTNGRLFYYNDFVKKLTNHGNLAGVRVSIHGHNSETHDELSGVKGSYKQVIQGFKNLNKLSIPFGVCIVITSTNYMYLNEIVKLVNKFKVNHYSFSFLAFTPTTFRDHKNLMIEYNKVTPILEKVVSQIIKTKQATVNIEKAPKCILPNFHELILYEPYLSSDYIKLKKCENCYHLQNCTGISKFYLDTIGKSEFIPFRIKN